MPNEDYRIRSILSLLVPQVVECLMDVFGMEEPDAIELVIDSRVYSLLEDEQTKLWHLSPRALAEMCVQEREQGFAVFPEGV